MRFATQAVTAAAAVGVAVAASSAFTASNTVEVSAVGQAATASSGYTVSAVDYTLGTADALAAVAFNVAPTTGTDAARTVRARLRAGDTYATCINGGSGTVWTCDLTGVAGLTAANAVTLDVVAAG